MVSSHTKAANVQDITEHAANILRQYYLYESVLSMSQAPHYELQKAVSSRRDKSVGRGESHGSPPVGLLTDLGTAPASITFTSSLSRRIPSSHDCVANLQCSWQSWCSGIEWKEQYSLLLNTGCIDLFIHHRMGCNGSIQRTVLLKNRQS